MIVTQAEIEEGRRGLQATPPRQKTKKVEEDPVFAKLSLRKTGRQLTGLQSRKSTVEERNEGWCAWSDSWFFRSCALPCLPEDNTQKKKKKEEEQLFSPHGARIAPPSETPVCGVCGEKIYGSDLFREDGAAYHKKCLRCARCRNALTSTTERRRLVCAACEGKAADDRLRKRSKSKHFVGATQQEAGTRKAPEAKGDVQGVLRDIGDELEEAYRSAMPRCAICGGTYAKSDSIRYEVELDLRLPKYHAECFALGRPRDGVVHSAQPPRLAAKNARQNFVVKLFDPASRTMVTLFFDRRPSSSSSSGGGVEQHKHHTKAENEEPASVDYDYAPADGRQLGKREAHLRSAVLALLDDTTKGNVSVAGDADFLFSSVHENVDDHTAVVVLDALKDRLRHQLRLVFRIDHLNDRARPDKATLHISFPSSHRASSSS